jgi:hypothetical protein
MLLQSAILVYAIIGLIIHHNTIIDLSNGHNNKYWSNKALVIAYVTGLAMIPVLPIIWLAEDLYIKYKHYKQ